MGKSVPFRVSQSLTDFSPLLLDLSYPFKRLKETGIDGIELVIGLKSRWNASYLRKLSEKYELPIVSMHQPAWSGMGLWFDGGFAKFAKDLGVKQITCHPIQYLSFGHPRMQEYLGKLSQLQEKYGVEILLENQAKKAIGIETDTYDFDKLVANVKQYDLKITLDLSHVGSPTPHKESWFPQILPYLGNIHVSSFTKEKDHLPLVMGDLHVTEFLEALAKENYQRLLTFEIYYPSLISLLKYDVSLIKKSVDIVHSVTV